MLSVKTEIIILKKWGYVISIVHQRKQVLEGWLGGAPRCSAAGKETIFCLSLNCKVLLLMQNVLITASWDNTEAVAEET